MLEKLLKGRQLNHHYLSWKFCGINIMSIFRFFFLAIATAMLSVLISCNQTPTISDNSTQSPGAISSPITANAGNQASGNEKININTAILSELDKFEAKLGVPALSHRIQGSRPYGSPEELVAKKVVTQEQFDQIKDMVTIEDVVLTGIAKDIDYMTKLGLMKGHLLVARELLEQQQPKQAEPHIGHPVEEIYVDVEEQLQERNVKEFKTSLISLQDLVKSKPNDAEVKTNFEASVQSVDTAIQALPENQRSSPGFVLQVINELLDAANSEYGAAIANGKVTAPIEYQDSRGFVNYANTLYEGISSQMAKEHSEAHQVIEASMSELTKAWPSATPPAAQVLTPDQVAQLIRTIEQNSQKVVNNSNTTANL